MSEKGRCGGGERRRGGEMEGNEWMSAAEKIEGRKKFVPSVAA